MITRNHMLGARLEKTTEKDNLNQSKLIIQVHIYRFSLLFHT